MAPTVCTGGLEGRNRMLRTVRRIHAGELKKRLSVLGSLFLCLLSRMDSNRSTRRANAKEKVPRTAPTVCTGGLEGRNRMLRTVRRIHAGELIAHQKGWAISLSPIKLISKDVSSFGIDTL